MSDRTYDQAAEEYDELSLYQSMARFSSCFSDVSLGELMALGGKFLELAHGATGADAEEQHSAQAITSGHGVEWTWCQV